MEKKQIPAAIDEINAEWLTGALTESGVLEENSVQNLNYKLIGEGQGYAGILARLSIEYKKPDEALPSTMIAKIPTQVAKSRLTSEAFWNYERENRLYEEILHQLPIRTPRCYYSDFDLGKGEKWMKKVFRRYGSLPKPLLGLYFIYAGFRNLRLKRRYILLLEDFGDLEQISQLEGCSFDDAKMIMKPMGAAHAALWESPQLEKSWLIDHADFTNMMAFMSDRWQPVLKKTHPGKVSPKMRGIFEWLKKNNNKLDANTKARPHTLVHTDYRLDNIFFDRKKNEIAVIDWQGCCRGLGQLDTAFFILSNCHTPLNREQMDELVATYHQGLVEGGVSNYNLDECMSDYTYGLLLATRFWLILFGGVEVEKDPNAIKLLGVILDRMKPVIETIDIDSLTL
jgi:hypothetical protein